MAKSPKKTGLKPKVIPKAKAKPLQKKVADKIVRAATPKKKSLPQKTATKKPAKRVLKSRQRLLDAIPRMLTPANGDQFPAGSKIAVKILTDVCQFNHFVDMRNPQETSESVPVEMVCMNGNAGSGTGTCSYLAPKKAGDWVFYITYLDDAGEKQEIAASRVTIVQEKKL